MSGTIPAAIRKYFLLAAALLFCAPTWGAFDVLGMAEAYDIVAPQGNLAILLRHRALLFALPAGLLIYAVMRPLHQDVCIAAAQFVAISFLIVFAIETDRSDALWPVAILDALIVVLLVIAQLLPAKPSQALRPQNQG